MRKNRHLYTQDDVHDALSAAGLETGDSAFFTTGLGMLGSAQGVKTQDDLNALHLNSYKNCVGHSGNIFVPTYSYTFGGSTVDQPKIYDPRSTPAEIGPFPNYFFKQDEVLRSLDPMVSVAGLGPLVRETFDQLPKTSYGHGCLYERFLNIPRMKAVSVGLGPNWTPFIHYADFLNKVAFRYDKLFYGGLRMPSGETDYSYWVYSVRARIEESWADAHRLGNLATEAGIWKFSELGRARVYVCNYADYFDFAMQELKKNSWTQARGPKVNVLEKEASRLGRQDLDLRIEGKGWHKDFMNRKEGRLSSLWGNLLRSLATIYSLKLYSIKTGDNFYGWIVPEAPSEIDSEASGMGEIFFGDLQPLKAKETQKHILICGYYTGEASELAALERALELFVKSDHSIFSKFKLRLAILPLPSALAAYVSRLELENEIESIIHLTHWPLDFSEHNPVAKQKISDFEFENYDLKKVHEIKSTELQSFVGELISTQERS